MAKIVTTAIQCDVCLDIGDHVEGETFAEWKHYSIDLCETHRKELVEPLRDVLIRFAPRAKAPAKPAKPKSSKLGPSDREVRDWARSNGVDVNPTGKVAKSARDAWFAAQ